MPTDEAVIVGLAAFFLFVGFVALWRITRDKTRRWQKVRVGVFVEREDERESPPQTPSKPPGAPPGRSGEERSP